MVLSAWMRGIANDSKGFPDKACLMIDENFFWWDDVRKASELSFGDGSGHNQNTDRRRRWSRWFHRQRQKREWQLTSHGTSFREILSWHTASSHKIPDLSAGGWLQGWLFIFWSPILHLLNQKIQAHFISHRPAKGQHSVRSPSSLAVLFLLDMVLRSFYTSGQ